ncbi:MAG: hypothetical protein IPL40_04785 [Proteobacteria bacterium]|nr:hypothetical protein [Pseudomonadota bacterium]
MSRYSPSWLVFALQLTALGAGSTGCLPTTSEAAFTGGRGKKLCQGVYQTCLGKRAGCTLDEGSYLEGVFPGGQSVLVETAPGDWTIKVVLFLAPDGTGRSPGFETEVNWYEPGCTDQYRYQLSREIGAQDLFQRAGADNVFSVEETVIEPGDHLVVTSCGSR